MTASNNGLQPTARGVILGAPRLKPGVRPKGVDVSVNLGQEIFDKLDGWANQLVTPALPLRVTRDSDDAIRLEFRQQIPESVMIGKLVRAVSGLRGALILAETGYIAECGAVLRIVSDLCTEISVIGLALDRGGELPAAVKDFVAQYFKPRARTQDEFASAERTRYVTREALLKVDKALAQDYPVDAGLLDQSHRYMNMAYDAYVHGAYETTMELWNQRTGTFDMRGHPSHAKREEFVEAVMLKMHEVVVAIELTAAKTSQAEMFAQTRQARRAMDATDPWRHEPAHGPA